MMPSFAFLQDLTIAGAGVWTLVLIAVITLIKVSPALKKLAMDENAQLRQDRRQDYRDLKGELEVLKSDFSAVNVRTEAMERYGAAVSLRLGQLEFVFSLVMEELEQIAPGNDIAKRARMLVSSLYPIPPISEHIQDFIDTMKAHHQTHGAAAQASNHTAAPAAT